MSFLNIFKKAQTRPKFVLMCGLPGSGKDEVVEKLMASEDYVLISKSDVKTKLFGEETLPTFTKSQMRQIHDEIKIQVRDALSQGKNVIYSASNLKMRTRMNMITFIKNENIDCEFICELVVAPYEQCIQEKCSDVEETGCVFITDFSDMCINFELPYFYEGYDDIHITRNVKPGYEITTRYLFNDLYGGLLSYTYMDNGTEINLGNKLRFYNKLAKDYLGLTLPAVTQFGMLFVESGRLIIDNLEFDDSNDTSSFYNVSAYMALMCGDITYRGAFGIRRSSNNNLKNALLAAVAISWCWRLLDSNELEPTMPTICDITLVKVATQMASIIHEHSDSFRDSQRSINDCNVL